MARPEAKIPHEKRIFCNRSLNMRDIRAIGFDMDYTIALYRPETFEQLAYKETLKKLVLSGYPEVILNWNFDARYMIRGLVIDKVRGNVLKIDRHRYVKVAYHGFEELDRKQRRLDYDAEKVLTYEEPDFALIDTLFTLADAYLFSQLIDLKESGKYNLNKTYDEIYGDVRSAIDLSHRDGSIKKRVADDPGRYIERDPKLSDSLKRIKESGRKVFMVTNSLWDYTNVVMNYALGNDSTSLNTNWLDNFDYVITGSMKPRFFMGSQPIYEIDLASGYLRNAETFNSHCKVYQGGHFKHLHDMLKVSKGSEILYVGDHIYGDILRSKKELGWRTMLVIQELEREIIRIQELQKLRTEYEDLLLRKAQIEDDIHLLSWDITKQRRRSKRPTQTSGENKPDKALQELQSEDRTLRETMRSHLREYHRKFHPIWGEIMKTGYQNSRFAAQVENYACLYTSRLTNLRFYSPEKTFRGANDTMPHDQNICSQTHGALPESTSKLD